MKTIVDYINDRLLSHTKIYLNESRGIFDGCYDLAIFLNEKITKAISKNKSYIEIDKKSIEDVIKQKMFFEKISLLIDRTSDIFTARYRLDNVNLSDSGLLEDVCIYIGVKEYSRYIENYVDILVHELTHAFNNYNLIIHGASSIYDMIKDIDYDRMRDFHAHNVPSIIRELRRSLYILQPYEKNSFISQLIANIKELMENGEIKELDRAKLLRTQTPHGIRYKKLVEIHEEANQKGITNTVATCTLMTQLGYPIYFFDGAETNFKITTLDDIEIFKALLAAKKASWQK